MCQSETRAYELRSQAYMRKLFLMALKLLLKYRFKIKIYLWYENVRELRRERLFILSGLIIIIVELSEHEHWAYNEGHKGSSSSLNHCHLNLLASRTSASQLISTSFAHCFDLLCFASIRFTSIYYYDYYIVCSTSMSS